MTNAEKEVNHIERDNKMIAEFMGWSENKDLDFWTIGTVEHEHTTIPFFVMSLSIVFALPEYVPVYSASSINNSISL